MLDVRCFLRGYLDRSIRANSQSDRLVTGTYKSRSKGERPNESQKSEGGPSALNKPDAAVQIRLVGRPSYGRPEG